MNVKKFTFLLALPLLLIGCKKPPQAKIVDIELDGEYPTLFGQYDEFSYVGLEVYATYSNNKKKQVNDFEVSSPDMTILGEQEVEVTYKDFSKSYSINIEYRNIPERGKIQYTLPASLNEEISEYEIKVDYHNDYFRHSATQKDDNLKMLSFGSTVVSDSVMRCSEFFGSMFFDDFVYYDYDEITEDTIGHFFARKEIDDFELYAVSIRGFEYQSEWANNFLIGDSGDHYGFGLRANEVFAHLVAYITTYHEADKTVKVWISGYSRAGAMSDFVSMKLMTTSVFSINSDTLFTYTFEAPASISEEHKQAYPNVFNLYNSTDLIPCIPPQQYGLFRTGTDIDIYLENVDELVANFDSNIQIPTFTAKSGKYSTQQEFNAYFVELMLEDTGNEGSMHSRQDFVNNYQSDLSYIIALLFTLPPETNAKVMAALQDIGSDALSIILGGNPLYEKVKNILDEDGVPYDDEKLESSTGKLCLFIKSHFSWTGGSLINELVSIEWGLPPSVGVDQKTMDNISRSVTMHYPEITYCLISNIQISE